MEGRLEQGQWGQGAREGDTYLVDAGKRGLLGWGREVGTAQFPESSSSTVLEGGLGLEWGLNSLLF